MANEELKAAAQKELLHRKAKAELDRRKGVSQSVPQQPPQEQAVPWYTPITSLPGNAYDMASGLAGGIADNVKKTAMDPKRLNPLVAAYQDLSPIAKSVYSNPQGAIDAVKQGASDNFGTTTRAWNTVATHPVDTMMTVAPFLGMAGKGSMLARAGSALDPVNAITKPAEALSSLAKPVPKGQTRFSAAILRKTMPKDLSAMDKLGPDAMLLDASPSMTGLARGVSANIGPGTDALVNDLIAREAGKNARLQTGAEKIFGKGRDPNAFAQEKLSQARGESKKFYEQAKQQTPEFRSDALNQTLAQQLTDPAKGMTEGARSANLKWMNQIDDAMRADNPQDAASRLHGLRQELDNITNPGSLATPDQKNLAEAAQNARNAVDDILKNRIPGFAEGDAAYSARMKESNAFDYGYNSLEGGKSAIWPETFGKDLQKMPADYVAQGQASRIGNAMGTQANDLSAVRKMIGGDGDFNRAKLTSTFGPRKVEQGVNLVDAEGAKSQNFADIVRNSKTAQSQQAAKMLEQNTPFQVDAGMTTLGLGAKITAKAANALIGKVSGRVSSSTSEALANALRGNKATAQSLLDELSNKKGISLSDKTLVRALLFSKGLQGGSVQP